MARNPPEIVVKADMGGFEISMGALVGGTEPEINDYLDLAARAINRQKAKIDLSIVLYDLADREAQLEALPEMERAYLRTRGEERARMRASFEAANQAGRRAANPALSQTQMQGLAQFDDATKAKQQEFTNRKAVLDVEIPALRKRADRCRAMMDGKERHELMDDPAQRPVALPDAAD
jgi:hypothetical protein